MKKENYIIKTDRLELRLVEVSDAPAAFEIFQKFPEINKHLTFLTPKKIEHISDYYESVNDLEKKDSLHWAIFRGLEFIGMVGLSDIIWMDFLGKRLKNSANFGYWLSPKFQGKGIMTEAAKAVLKFGFETLELHRVHAKHIDANDASGNVLTKCGFKYIGTERDACSYDGQWWDEKLYDLLEGDLKK